MRWIFFVVAVVSLLVAGFKLSQSDTGTAIIFAVNALFYVVLLLTWKMFKRKLAR